MSKKQLRAMALGLFLSGIVLVGYILLFDGGTSSSNGAEIEALEQEIYQLEEQVARLEVAQLSVEQDTSEEDTAEENVEEPDNSEESNDNENENSDQEDNSEESNDNDSDQEDNSDESNDDEDNADSEDNAEEEPDEEEVITTTVTVNDGQPSSVASQQLANAGIIESVSELESYLDDNNMAVLVRPGSYEITSDMSLSEIANILTGRSN